MESIKRSIINLINSSIQSGNEITDEEICEHLKISLDEARFHLDELDKGSFIKLVRSHTFCSNGEEMRVIAITPRGSMFHHGKISFGDKINSSSQVFKINNNAPVVTQQIGNNNTANVTQNIGLESAEVLQLIAALRQDISTLPSERQTVAIEALDDIESEVITPAKASRIRGGLLSLWSVTKDLASFTNAVTALAQRFGLDNLLS